MLEDFNIAISLEQYSGPQSRQPQIISLLSLCHHTVSSTSIAYPQRPLSELSQEMLP